MAANSKLPAAGESAIPVAQSGAPVRVTGLKADYRDRPLSLDSRAPRLSWRLESSERNVRQAAYRVLVASSPERLRTGLADLWDSGKIASRSSVGIEYAGRPLLSRQCCWWSVQVWDEPADRLFVSEPSKWEMGLLDREDWSAQWLAVEDRVAREDREAGLRWIWGPDASPERPIHRFRLAFELRAATSGGALIVAVKQCFWWSQITQIWVDGEPIAGPGRWIERPPAPFAAPAGTTISNLTCQHLALKPLSRGRHVLAVEVGVRSILDWSFAVPGTPAYVPALAALCRFEFEDDATLRLTSGPQWRTCCEDHVDPQWYRRDFDDSRWLEARPDADERYQPWPPQPAMHLRKAFAVASKISKARLYITALGVYEARLNDSSVGNEVLAPGPAQYDKGAPYQTFDVTSLIRQGHNVLGVTVADGWYASFDGRFAFGDPPRRCLAQLELSHEDGSLQIIASGPGWSIAQSAIRTSQIKFGETRDNRCDPLGWSLAEYDDAHWEPAAVVDAPAVRLVAQSTPPIRVIDRIRPRAITRTREGDYVIDFGICLGGWCELDVVGRVGAQVRVRYSELLAPSGEIDPLRLLDDPCGDAREDLFVLRGDPEGERLAATFAYRGFRYVQVSGVESSLDVGSVIGAVIHTDLARTGTINADNDLIRGVFDLSLQSYRSNFVGVPLDNNTREGRGYMGEVGVFGEAAAYLLDVSTFFANHLDMMVAEQAEDGTFPIYAPRPQHVALFPLPGETPGWGNSVVIVAARCWRQYGDTAIISRNWDAMNRNAQFILDHNPEHVWRNRRGFDFGDWLSVEPTPTDLFATALWAHTTALLAEMADAIGKHSDAKRLAALHELIRNAFRAEFVRPDGEVGNGSQTSYVLALAFDLLPEEARATTVDRLVAAVRMRSPAGLSTGTWGTRFILDVLAVNGRSDVAYDLLTSTAFPSWGYMLQRGATAMWENWQSTLGTQNQPALGSVAAFLFHHLAGINAATPAFEEIDIHPRLAAQAPRGGGDYDSIMGRISTDWAWTQHGAFTLEVTLPANTTAHVSLPTRAMSRIVESGVEVASRNDMSIVRRSADATVIGVGSGSYRFEVIDSRE